MTDPVESSSTQHAWSSPVRQRCAVSEDDKGQIIITDQECMFIDIFNRVIGETRICQATFPKRPLKLQQIMKLLIFQRANFSISILHV